LSGNVAAARDGGSPRVLRTFVGGTMGARVSGGGYDVCEEDSQA
jgi:hypothetical protein